MWLQRHKHAFAALLGGIAISLSLAPLHWWPLSFAGAALIFWSIENTPIKRSPWVGWWSGMGLFGSGASWVYVSIHYHSDTPALLAAIMTFIFCAGLALLPAAMAWIYARFFRQSAARLFSFTALWVLFDALRGVILTGFPWLYVGTAHTDSPLGGLFAVIGVNGVTALTVMMATLLVSAPQYPRRTTAQAIFVAILIAGASHIDRGIRPIDSASITVGIAQGNIAQEEKWKPENVRSTLSTYTSLTEALWDSDIIIWPESAITIDYWRAASFLNAMHDIATMENSTLITGIPYISPEGDNIHNSLTAVGMGEGLYHKQKLVPFGEYVPLADILRGTLAFFDLPMSSFDRGQPQQALLRAGEFRLAPFICYEMAYSELVRTQLRDANFIVTVSNDAWFGRSWAPWQHQQIARARAMETGRYVLRATNNGISSIINEKGTLIATTPQFEPTTLQAQALPMQGETPYVRWGSMPLWLLAAAMLLGQSAFIRGQRHTET
ncbi:MAG TPA: apolipoprotein N-acyltransferase [Pseudomonadales bacterium]|nr:apolipoprotein N-acyltransferase [Pseudomonadales bacterium]